MTAELLEDWDNGLTVAQPGPGAPEESCKVAGCRNPRSTGGRCEWHRQELHRKKREAALKGSQGRSRKTAKQARARLADIRWMLDLDRWGRRMWLNPPEHPERICARLDPPTNPVALGRWLERRGQPQLARIFNTKAGQQEART